MNCRNAQKMQIIHLAFCNCILISYRMLDNFEKKNYNKIDFLESNMVAGEKGMEK